MGKRLTFDDYEITKEGQVINKTNGHILKPQPNSKGYLRVRIDGKLRFVHRLVAEKYIPNPEHKEQVNHKNGDKTDNRTENLEWVSNQENRDHAVKNGLHLSGEACPYSKLTLDQVKYIRQHPEITNREYACMYGVSEGAIYDIKHYKDWKTY